MPHQTKLVCKLKQTKLWFLNWMVTGIHAKCQTFVIPNWEQTESIDSWETNEIISWTNYKIDYNRFSQVFHTNSIETKYVNPNLIELFFKIKTNRVILWINRLCCICQANLWYWCIAYTKDHANPSIQNCLKIKPKGMNQASLGPTQSLCLMQNHINQNSCILF